jgi:serine phosphatase RsbU (regulator of sigma subunit)
MSLRTRLIVAFFTLSVVPLAAVTFYTYRSNVNALRDAAEHEADLLAGELSQRMQLVTTQLSERVEHLMDLAELQAEVDKQAAAPPPAKATPAKPTAPVTVVTTADAVNAQVARSLGEAAMLLNNVELMGMRNFPFGGRSGGGGANANRPTGDRGSRSQGQAQTGSVSTSSGQSAGQSGGQRRGDDRSGKPQPPHTPPPQPAGPAPVQGTGGTRGTPGAATVPPLGQTGKGPQPPPAPGAPGAPNPTSQPGDPAQQGRLMVDLQPIRREMYKQILGDQSLQSLTPEQRQKVADEVNQRMLGVVQGIKLSAFELRKQAENAAMVAAVEADKAKASSAKAQTAVKPSSSASPSTATPPPPSAAPAPKPAPPPTPVPTSLLGADPKKDQKTSSSLSGNKLGVKIESNGQVVRQVNAELNLPNVLQTVFTTTRGDGGEVPFAVAQDGRIYTRTDKDRATVDTLGTVAKADGPSTARLNDWIVVTTKDPSGSGLKLGIARPFGDSLATLRRATARNAGLGLMFIVIALIGIVPLSAQLTRNLSTLSDGVHRLAQGDFRTRVPVRGKDEVGRLAEAFNQMASDIEKHQKTAVEQERFKRELELGRQIQNEMLPHAPLKLGLTEIKGVSVPAREVGGDFFNYFEIGHGQIALLVGDVSGKGVGAALLMANIQASLRTRLALGQDLSALAEEIDRDIEANSPGPVYATLFVGILDPASRRLRFVNAGHHPQYVLRKGGPLEHMASTGLPVGLLAGRGHREQSAQLAAGDVLFFYTDGCVEAESETLDMFGADRLEALLSEYANNPQGDLLEWVEKGISAFRGKQEPFDDATMMAVKVG